MSAVSVKSGDRLSWHGTMLVCVLLFAIGCASAGWSQTAPFPPQNLSAPPANGAEANKPDKADKAGNPPQTSADPVATEAPEPEMLTRWEGLPVRRILITGVEAGRIDAQKLHLAQTKDSPLSREAVERSLRQLFATGVFETIRVEGVLVEAGVALTFRGTPRTFIGTVSVEGAKGATLNAQLQRASDLAAGTRFTQAKLSKAAETMRRTLADNGFQEPTITSTLKPHPEDQLVDIAFRVVSGPQARVGSIEVTGDSGMSRGEFRTRAHLHPGSRMEHDTADHAMASVMKRYQKQDRLEAEVKLSAQLYDAETKKTKLGFTANQGPVVHVLIDGASLSPEKIKHVIPLFEEGTVDDDLLNEGDRRLRDYYQRLGYFDVKVDHEQKDIKEDAVTILYHVHLGSRRRLETVSVEGNHYFTAATLKELLSVHAAGGWDHHGTYSQALITADIHALQALYQNNGFSQIKIASETHSDTQGKASMKGKPQPMAVVYRIAEGDQQRVGAVSLQGAEKSDTAKLLKGLNTTAGQLLSPQNLAGDRDDLLNDYLSRGFDQVRIEIVQQTETEDASKVDVTFRIHEGQQVFVRKVLLSGLEYTRPQTVAKAITLHPGDPLNETALAETQRNMYEFALFNEVDTAVVNPTGGETYKTILLQASEARRWALTYGGGFEVQTGTPQNNCGKDSSIRTYSCGNTPSVSPRVLIDITRNSLFGREQSASLRGTYGLLEQKIDLLYQVPHFYGHQNLGLTVSGGYAKSLDVTTYVSQKFESGMRWTERFETPGSFLSKANTLIYEFDFRVIKVDKDNLQVASVELDPLATAQTVTGPSLTWIRDTRDSPLDAHRGTYSSFQEFLSSASFGAKVQFNRLDLSNSSFYSFDKGRFVIARNSRYGQERAFGAGNQKLIPLPERLYAGGATSLRGFSLNSAGPRDPETGYPVGGAGTLTNSTEFRFPPPTLPLLGNSVSVVLFHDMGNVFSNASDAWASALRFYQPNRDSCKNPETLPINSPYNSTGLKSPCSFNYFSHAPGVGMRYHTPVGPIRIDFSYNLNTPIYPIAYSYSTPSAPKTVGEANHFNFFFSLGQTF